MKGNVDFATLPLLQGFEDFDTIALHEEELFLVAKAGSLPEHSFSTLADGQYIVHFEYLKDEPFVLLKIGHGMRYALDVLFDYHGYKPKIIMETTNNETAMGLAVAGMGLAVVPSMTVELLRGRLDFNVCKISDAGLKRTIAIILRKNSYLSIQARECTALAREIFKSFNA